MSNSAARKARKKISSGLKFMKTGVDAVDLHACRRSGRACGRTRRRRPRDVSLVMFSSCISIPCGFSLMWMFFSCVKASISSKHSSRPMPDCFTPPNGAPRKCLPTSLIHTKPASTAIAVRCAVEMSLVQIEQVRPYSTAFTSLEHLRLVRPFEDAEHGAEDFLARDAHRRRHAGEHGRLDIEALGELRIVGRPAAAA